MKDCMFQFADINETFVDTGLISIEEAVRLWDENKEKFIDLVLNGISDPGMCIWVNCKDNSDYHKDILHVNSNSIVKGNRIYELIEINTADIIGGMKNE